MYNVPPKTHAGTHTHTHIHTHSLLPSVNSARGIRATGGISVTTRDVQLCRVLGWRLLPAETHVRDESLFIE